MSFDRRVPRPIICMNLILLFTILKIRSNYIRRVSYPEPGITTKAYFKDLREKFSAQVSEVIDQINNL